MRADRPETSVDSQGSRAALIAILRGEHEMVVQTINGMGGSTQFAHSAKSSRLKARGFPFPERDPK